MWGSAPHRRRQSSAAGSFLIAPLLLVPCPTAEPPAPHSPRVGRRPARGLAPPSGGGAHAPRGLKARTPHGRRGAARRDSVCGDAALFARFVLSGVSGAGFRFTAGSALGFVATASGRLGNTWTHRFERVTLLRAAGADGKADFIHVAGGGDGLHMADAGAVLPRHGASLRALARAGHAAECPTAAVAASSV